VFPARLRPHRVLEDRARRHIERVRERADRLRRRGRQIVREESQPAQSAELQRDPQLPGRVVLAANEHQILAIQTEVPPESLMLDRLRPPVQPRDLSVERNRVGIERGQ